MVKKREEPAVSKLGSPRNTKPRPLCFFQKIIFSTFQVRGSKKKFICKILQISGRGHVPYFYSLYRQIVIIMQKNLLAIEIVKKRKEPAVSKLGSPRDTKPRPLCFFQKIIFLGDWGSKEFQQIY